MNVMSGHVILFEIQSNLSCCSLVILDLQQGAAVGATAGHVSTSEGHHQEVPATVSVLFTCCSHSLLCINDMKFYFSTKWSHFTKAGFLYSVCEGSEQFFKTLQLFWRHCCGDKIRDFVLTRRSLRWACCHSPSQSKTAASRLLMKHCHPSTGSVDRVIYWLEHIDAWAFET